MPNKSFLILKPFLLQILPFLFFCIKDTPPPAAPHSISNVLLFKPVTLCIYQRELDGNFFTPGSTTQTKKRTSVIPLLSMLHF